MSDFKARFIMNFIKEIHVQHTDLQRDNSNVLRYTGGYSHGKAI